MQNLKERIQSESKHLGRGVIKVDSFLNHQIDPELMHEIGSEFARRLTETNPTKILTIDTGGIAPAFVTASLLHVPLIVARKRRFFAMSLEELDQMSHGATRNLKILGDLGNRLTGTRAEPDRSTNRRIDGARHCRTP